MTELVNVDRPVRFYALDVIISVGYRVKSKRGSEFRQWASKILKQYMIEGYEINEKCLHYTAEVNYDMHGTIYPEE
ncbi:MAG: virulence RhuM family protein [Eubacterium sp.]|nr:virulence RhuM family protein [Eubacterium sp.]